MACPVALFTSAKLGKPSSSFTLVLYFSSLIQCCIIHFPQTTIKRDETVVSNKIKFFLVHLRWLRQKKKKKTPKICKLFNNVKKSKNSSTEQPLFFFGVPFCFLRVWNSELSFHIIEQPKVTRSHQFFKNFYQIEKKDHS